MPPIAAKQLNEVVFKLENTTEFLQHVSQILKRGHSNEIYWAVVYCGTVYNACNMALTFDSVDMCSFKCDDSNELISTFLHVALFICLMS